MKVNKIAILLDEFSNHFYLPAAHCANILNDTFNN